METILETTIKESPHMGGDNVKCWQIVQTNRLCDQRINKQKFQPNFGDSLPLCHEVEKCILRQLEDS